jgi:hypothetical protein
VRLSDTAQRYRDAVRSVLKEKDGLELVLKVYNRLRQKDEAGTLEGDEIVRLVVLRHLDHEIQAAQ